MSDDKVVRLEPTVSKPIDEIISGFIKAIRTDAEFEGNIKYIRDKEIEIEKFIEEGKTSIDPKNQLVVLRKWNSYTPVLPSKNENFVNKGGGYFLKIKDIGIIIDPGFNFIENFLNAGFKLDDIDHIFISHAHNDHTVELEAIFSLLYKRNRKVDITDNKKIKLYMNLGSFKKFAGYFELSKADKNSYIEDIILLNKHQLIKVTNSIEVFTTQAKHHEMITTEYSLGFIFKIILDEGKQQIIKFTCDTGWDEENEEKNLIASGEFQMDDINILVAHTGSITDDELSYDDTKSLAENKDKLYKNHLGLVGTFAAIFYYKPEISLLSEFGEEMNAVRHKIADKIKDLSGRKIIATDLNFRIDLDNLDIMCFKDKKFYNYEKIDTYYNRDQLYFISKDNLEPVEKAEIDSHLGIDIKVF